MLDQCNGAAFQLADTLPSPRLDADNLTSSNLQHSTLDAHHQIGVELERGNAPIVDKNLDGGVMRRADRMIGKRDQKCFVSGLLAAFKVIQQIAMLRPSRFQNLIDLNVERILELVRYVVGHDTSVDVTDACSTPNLGGTLLAFCGFDETGLPVAGGG